MGVWLTTLVLLAVIALLIYLYFTWNFNYWKKNGVAGPKPKFFTGTFPSVLSQKRNMIYDINDYYRQYKKTEKFIGVFTIRDPELLILSPELAREIYTSKFRNFHDNFAGHALNTSRDPVFALNPFMLKGAEWKEKRAEVTPALTANRIKASYPVMQKVCTRLSDFIKNKLLTSGKDADFDTRDLCQRFTIENVADCIYGIDAQALSEGSSPLLKQAQQMATDFLENFALFFLLNALPLASRIYPLKFMADTTFLFFNSLLSDAIELRKKVNTDRQDFLNYILQLQEKKGLTQLELSAHVFTFFADGFETSATVLSHTLLNLGRYKEVQSKLRTEIENNLEEDGGISFDKLVDMPYLDQCINESLRIFSPIVFATKICTEETELENYGGRKLSVKKGTVCHMPTFCFHKDEDIYPNPEEFIPERFSPENGGEKKYKDQGAFVPFGDGPRICPGQKFGLTQVKAALCEIVKNFDVTVSDKTRKDNILDPKHIIAYLDGNVWLKFKELKN